MIKNFEIITPQIFSTSREDSLDSYIDTLTNYINSKIETTILFWHASEQIGTPFIFGEISQENIQKINRKLDEVNSELIFIYGGYDFNFYDTITKYFSKKLRIISLPTYLFHYTKFFLEKITNKSIENIEIKNSFDKLYICLNNKAKIHRSMTLDYLYKHDLFNYGIISNHNLISNDNYKFKFWKEEVIIIEKDIFNEDLPYHTKLNMGFVGDRLFNGLVNIVTESSHIHQHYITEKTIKNFFLEQIFICIGARNQNLVLKDFGFELYDEIFDYGFDSKENLEDRVKGLIENMVKIKDENYFELYKRVEKKILHNKSRAIEICENDPYIPIELILLYKNNQDYFDNYFIYDGVHYHELGPPIYLKDMMKNKSLV